MTRLRVLLVALLAAVVVGCAAVPKTLAEARPALVLAYEAGFRAWTYLDGVNAGQYSARAEAVREAIEHARPEIEKQCGDMVALCMLSAYQDIMSKWERESGYGVRTVAIESAREGLSLFRAAISSDEMDTKLAVDSATSTAKDLRTVAVSLDAQGFTSSAVVDRGIAALEGVFR